MPGEGILSSPLAGKNECQLCEKSFVYRHDLLRHQRTIHGNKSFECPLCSYKTARKDKLVHIKKYTPRLPLIKPLTGNVMKLKLSSHLRKSIFPTKLNNRPTLNEKSHIKTRLHFPNIHNRKSLLIQSIIINF